ncbi:hypothetical protein QQF64_004055 [Cirrhinus molitorella]|uniref:Uncharacterized protein n=1 Tax=Cirrhinus molitorella TaxID=172907 RepID=A0ABR3MN29_9TELE
MTTARSCHFILRSIRTIRPILNTYCTKLQAPVFSGNSSIAGQPASATQPLEGIQNTVCFQPPEILSHYSSQVSSLAASICKNSIGNTVSGSHRCQCSPCPHYLHAVIELCVSPHEGLLPVQLQKVLHPCF